MTLEELAEKYRYSMPGTDMVCEYEAAIPIYRVRLKASLLRRLEIPIIPQFVLQLIDIGHDVESDIAKALGLHVKYVRTALAQLDQLLLVQRQYGSTPDSALAFTITDKGKQELDNVLSATQTERIELQIDGFTGQFSAIGSSQLQAGPDLKKLDVSLLPPVRGTRPELNNLNDRIKELNTLLQPEISETDAQYDLIEIQEIEVKPLQYKRVNILVFRDSQTERIEFIVFEGYEQIAAYAQVLSQRERAGQRTIPPGLLSPLSEAIGPSEIMATVKPELERLSRIIAERNQAETTVARLQSELDAVSIKSELDQANTESSPNSITARSARIEELEALLQQKTNELENLRMQPSGERLVQGGEHRNLLLKSIKTANHFLIIVSPWINKKATDREVIKAIESAIKRGVWIAIGYGMPPKYNESSSDYIDEDVKHQLEDIMRQSNGDHLHLEWLGNTHEKILVCDTKYCVVTSFNWLSYRGDRGFRNETGLLTKDDKNIAEITSLAMNRFKSLPQTFFR